MFYVAVDFFLCVWQEKENLSVQMDQSMRDHFTIIEDMEKENSCWGIYKKLKILVRLSKEFARSWSFIHYMMVSCLIKSEINLKHNPVVDLLSATDVSDKYKALTQKAWMSLLSKKMHHV